MNKDLSLKKNSNIKTVIDEKTINFNWPNCIYDENDRYDEKSVLNFLKSLADDDSIIIPLTEETILPSCQINSEKCSDGLQLGAALQCVDRLLFRQKMDQLQEFNVNWKKASSLPSIEETSVLKARISTINLGVQFINDKNQIKEWEEKISQRLGSYLKSFKYFNKVEKYDNFIVEEYINGPQFEISGVIGESGKILDIFAPLKQVWNESETVILQYQKVKNKETIRLMEEVARKTLSIFDLSYCGFCMEMRIDENGDWKIIEINLRMGEDPSHYKNTIGFEPSERMIRTIIENEN